MTSDAESHAEEDKKRRALAEAKNEADTLVYTVEKSVKEHGDKISEDDKTKINDALEKCKNLKDTTDNADELKKAVEELTQASHKLAEEIYKTNAAGAEQAGAQPGGGQTASSEGGAEKEDVVEAEFEETEEKKDN